MTDKFQTGEWLAVYGTRRRIKAATTGWATRQRREKELHLSLSDTGQLPNTIQLLPPD